MNEQEQKLQAEIDEIKKDIETIILVQYKAYQRMDEVIGILDKLVGVRNQTTRYRQVTHQYSSGSWQRS